MHRKVLFLSLILLMQACGRLLAETPAPEQTDSPGILHSLLEKAREAKATVKDFRDLALDFFGAYYEDHIQPVTGSYAEWASNVKGSVWEKIQTTVDNYSPFKATNATA